MMANTERLSMYLCFIAALVMGCAAVVAQGPLPGDLPVTRSMQAWLGPHPPWAVALTRSASPPLVFLAVPIACALAFAKGGRSIAVLPAIAYPGALLVNFAFRAVVFAPRPDGAMVAVAKASSDSGLPSTFALVYGGVLGVVVVARARRAIVGRWITFAAITLIAAGCASRIVLGGHWPSQMVASVLLGFGMAYLLHEAARRVIVGASSNRRAPVR